MGKKAAKKDYDRLKKPLNPPLPSTFLHSNPSQKNISNIYLWINLWITISNHAFYLWITIIDKPYKPLYTKDMNIYRVSLFDYDRAFDLEIFAQTEEEAKAMALREEPYMTIQRVVCLT